VFAQLVCIKTNRRETENGKNELSTLGALYFIQVCEVRMQCNQNSRSGPWPYQHLYTVYSGRINIVKHIIVAIANNLLAP